MELRELRAFVTVAETLHFGRAAERLHIVQPAITQQIRKLESELGVRLFERDTRSVRLTSVGAEFLREARGTIAQLERARLIAARAQRGEVGRVEFAHGASIAFSGVLSRLLREASRSMPDLSIGVIDLEAEPQIRLLLEGAIDIGLMRLPVSDAPDELAVRTVHSEPAVACLPTEHPLSGGLVPVSNLRDEPFVTTTLREGLGFFDTQIKICRAAGFEPRIVTRSHQFVSIVSLVGAGRGVALVPASISRLRLPDVTYCGLAGSTLQSEIAMMWHRDRVTPAIARIIALSDELIGQGAFAS